MATVTELNLADLETFGEVLEALGGISPDRVRLKPRFGTATEADLEAVNNEGRGIYERIDGVLVSKPLGKLESILAGALIAILRAFVMPRRLGIVTAPDGPMRLAPTTTRFPDVAFISWDSIPAGPLSERLLADVVPDLAIEVLSPSNTRAEMARKRRESFAAGVKLVWEFNPADRTVAVFVGPEHPIVLDATQTLDGGDVLPGFALPLAELFGELERPEA
jgi:Uma2 family endonuclease